MKTKNDFQLKAGYQTKAIQLVGDVWKELVEPTLVLSTPPFFGYRILREDNDKLTEEDVHFWEGVQRCLNEHFPLSEYVIFKDLEERKREDGEDES